MLHGLDPFPPAEPLTPDQFKAAMRKLAAAVTLITVFGPGGRNGLIHDHVGRLGTGVQPKECGQQQGFGFRVR